MISLLDTVTLKNGREVTVVGFDLDRDGSRLLEVAYDSWNIITGKYGHTKLFVNEKDVITGKYVIANS